MESSAKVNPDGNHSGSVEKKGATSMGKGATGNSSGMKKEKKSYVKASYKGLIMVHDLVASSGDNDSGVECSVSLYDILESPGYLSKFGENETTSIGYETTAEDPSQVKQLHAESNGGSCLTVFSTPVEHVNKKRRRVVDNHWALPLSMFST
ncbi:unnamed protein product [Notodromas monacha]|uniref:Uncharacterized protein n=1 Tax=Notodromas monacha TaxID=399045 RepID=A0A7R9BSP0_9CRUS|nr:unnamed protein product [Notodromas monacha]CAG0921007.1 unnamed protein product [Notodromas monacha]